MKKLKTLMVLCLCSLLFVPYAFSAAAVVTTASITRDVGKNGTINKYVYTSTDSVVVGDGNVSFKLNTPNRTGQILATWFESSSPDTDLWFSEIDNQTKTSVKTFALAENFVTGQGVAFENAYFFNQDSPVSADIYLTIDEQDNATNDWNLTVLYGR